MTGRTLRRRVARKARARGKQSGARASKRPTVQPRELDGRSLVTLFTDLAAELTRTALRFAAETAGLPVLKPEQLRLVTPQQRKTMRETGLYLRDLREVAGLTLRELSDAMDLEDHSLLEAAERGAVTLSFELILRLAALLARHDPIPFIVRFVRTYNPELWKILDAWGIGRLPTHFERERQFINIYRRHDGARKLSDEGFARVLTFTNAAFEMSLRFAAGHEGVTDKELEP